MSAAEHPITGIILAAGESSRMGEPKSLLDWGGKPLLQHQIDALTDAGCAPVVVVLGAAAETVQAKVSCHTPCLMVHNPDYRSGRASSLRVGAVALPDGLRDGGGDRRHRRGSAGTGLDAGTADRLLARKWRPHRRAAIRGADRASAAAGRFAAGRTAHSGGCVGGIAGDPKPPRRCRPHRRGGRSMGPVQPEHAAGVRRRARRVQSLTRAPIGG